MANITPTISATLESYDYQQEKLNVLYTIFELLVAMFAIAGNALVILVFRKERRLRRRTNYYIVSLAAADFLVGLIGIPFAIMSSIGMPRNLYACLFIVSILVVLCTISIFSLLAVSIDRYWAVLYPLKYSQNVRTKTALVIISICWVSGSIVGFLPLMGWHKHVLLNGRCFFLDVMDYNYLVFLYVATIISPAALMLVFYTHIYRVVVKQLRPTVVLDLESGGSMLRVLRAAQKREVKATINLSIIVVFFAICWLPLYTINCLLAFCSTCQINPTVMLVCIILSHINSAGNPIVYACHLKDFRSALQDYLSNIFHHRNRNAISPNFHYTVSQRQNVQLRHASSLNNIHADRLIDHNVSHTVIASKAIVPLVSTSIAKDQLYNRSSTLNLTMKKEHQFSRSVCSGSDESIDFEFTFKRVLCQNLTFPSSIEIRSVQSPSSLIDFSKRHRSCKIQKSTSLWTVTNSEYYYNSK